MSLRPLLALSCSRPLFRALHSSYPAVQPPNSSYLSEVLRTAHLHPHRSAIVEAVSGRRFSYADLQDAILRFGGFLQEKCGRQKLVGVFLDNSADLVFSCYGALAAGCVAVPVVSARSSEELRHSLGGVDLVVTAVDRLDLVRDALCPETLVLLTATSPERCRRLRCHSLAAIFEGAGPAALDDFDPVRPDDDLAFLLSSGGTTGAPKKVALSHNNLGVNVRQAQALREFDAAQRNVMLGVLPLGHSNGVTNVMGSCFHVGATLVVLPRFQPQSFLTAIEEFGVTAVNIVTPLVMFLLESELVQRFDLSSLQLVLSGGAPLSADLQAALQSKLEALNPAALVAQGYGCTEAAPVTHMWPSRARLVDLKAKMGSVGVLAPSTECRVMAPDSRQEMPAGEAGELEVRGPQVMKGYFASEGRPEEAIDEEGWLRTGDVGHFDEDGFFYISDRIKELIKFKGFQVSPSEIEAVLLSHPKVSDCAVVGLPDRRAGELPVAFVVPRAEPPSKHDLQDLVASALADHKQLRGGVVFVDELPRSAAGKLLRRNLRDSLR